MFLKVGVAPTSRRSERTQNLSKIGQVGYGRRLEEKVAEKLQMSILLEVVCITYTVEMSIQKVYNEETILRRLTDICLNSQI